VADDRDEFGLEATEGQDDRYVIEDTGESLSDFDVEAATSSPTSAGSAEAEQLREENKALKDQYLRKLADFDNFRKRSDREKQDYFRYALADTIRTLLPVLDNFERALASGAEGEELRKGIELIHKQLWEAMQKIGVEPVDQASVPFDPTVHEAVMREERSDMPSHTVVEVLQKGYQLQDRLLRPAMVKVAVGGPDQAETETT
jgi:molecular chaperone GrpE